MPDKNTDSVLTDLSQSIGKLVSLHGLSKLIPEVGSNFVFCHPNSKQLTKVAGLTGRIILVRGKPEAVGEVDYGWAPYMGPVILLAHQLDRNIRSAISLRYSPSIVDACKKIGLNVVEFQLPDNQSNLDCVAISALKFIGSVPQALFDTGAIGLEALVILFASSPDQIVKWVQEILSKLKPNVREACGR
ncbi:MAG: thiamine-phosphate synthase family protein [Promethearchaeota archaeon]